MTTHNYSAVMDHTSTAGYRAWGSGIKAGLAAAGLVQTADTGQIDWTTVNRPAASNNSGGYEIWRLPSSALYLKLSYGTGVNTNTPMLWVQVGTGSNGTGTLTGQTTTATLVTSGVADPQASSLVTLYTTYICVTDDGMALIHALNGAGTNPIFFFAVHRSVDSTGAITSTGFKLVRGSGGTMPAQDVRTAATASTKTDSASHCFAVGLPSSSIDTSGNNRFWLSWSDYGEGMQPHIGYIGYVVSEWTEGTTKSLTPFGSTAHTYFAVGALSSSGPITGGGTTYGIAVLYE